MTILSVSHVVPVFVDVRDKGEEYTVFGYRDYSTGAFIIPSENQRIKVGNVDKFNELLGEFIAHAQNQKIEKVKEECSIADDVKDEYLKATQKIDQAEYQKTEYEDGEN